MDMSSLFLGSNLISQAISLLQLVQLSMGTVNLPKPSAKEEEWLPVATEGLQLLIILTASLPKTLKGMNPAMRSIK